MAAPANQNIRDMPETSPMPASTSISPADLDFRLVRDVAQVEDAWRRLEAREWASLNQSLDWCRAWVNAHGTQLLALTGSKDGNIYFLLPLEIVDQGFGHVARMPGGRFNNFNTGLFDANVGILSADDRGRFRQAMRAALKNAADLLAVDQIPLDWNDLSHPLAPLASVQNQNHSFQLPLLGSMDATLSQVNAKARRKKFRVQVRRLEAIGGFEHVIAETREQQHALLDAFFRQKGERLSASGLPDVFAPRATRDFLHRLLDAPANDGNRLLAMHAIRLKGAHEGHLAAITGLSRKGGHVLCQFGSIDDSIGADASPGELLFWLVIEHSIAAGATIFDFGIGDQPYKRSWCNRDTVLHDILLPISLRGQLLGFRHMVMTKAKAAVKRNPRFYDLIQRWRARRGTLA